MPAVWVCNDIRAIDPAYLRRFDLVAQFRTPPRKVRERIVKRCFSGALLSDAGIAALSELETLPPAQIERAAKVVKALESLQSYDLGGITLGYSPTNRIGSRYVEVTVIGSNGRLMK